MSFGGVKTQSLPPGEQDTTLARVLPVLRGLASKSGHKLAHVDRQAAVMEFVNSRELEPLAAMGTSCPDHFLRTKIRPLILDEATLALDGKALADAVEAKTRRLPRRLQRLLRTLQARRTARRCATRTR